MMGFDLKYLLLILSANLLPTLSSRFFWSKSDTHGMSVIMRCKNNKKPSIYVNRSLSTNLEKKKKRIHLCTYPPKLSDENGEPQSVVSTKQSMFYLNTEMINNSDLISVFNSLTSKQSEVANSNKIFPCVTATYWWS